MIVIFNRIHILMITDSLSINGISSVIFNYAERINTDKFKITIICGSPVADKYRSLAEKLHIDIVELPSRKRSTFSYYKLLLKEMRSGYYDIVHIHGNSSSISIELLLAKIAGIKKRIAHSHNTMCDFKAHRLLIPLFRILYTDAFACGQKAGEWLFGSKPFYIMHNGFEINKFIFSQKYREEIRLRLGINDAFVIGHIGRINYQKNQDYLLDIFEIVAREKEDAVLLIVGTGPDESKIKDRIKKSSYRERIILYGETKEPEKIYMAMDIMVFPSRYEGLPVTLLEAQISGLPCIISDSISSEVCFTDEMKMLSIEQEPSHWAAVVLDTARNNNRESSYQRYGNEIEKYNISRCVNDLQKKYVSIYKRK